ncbi:DUF2057 domain-containing protein [Vibrio sp. SCSIO 43137]|uniref:DUF2057 domain-containing protein n=1 Tax=Vibrio sp. SCSIO 43137 TaxID=3021011 RepID=UPI0023083333|nr:DUF2057 domain-containing protein [Vibrio sp. SCSIO 43137]WCE30693.1 DUF2057 domain-containing protein [Vibrio sp. SCSIO 43137]
MKKVLVLIALFLPLTSLANVLQLRSGMSVEVINGEKTESQLARTQQLLEGRNQITAMYEATFRVAGKDEYIASKPYLLTFDTKEDVQLEVVSNRYKVLKKAFDAKQPIFKLVNASGQEVKMEQFVIPTTSSFLPYANVPALVEAYNKEHGIYFSNEAGYEQFTPEKITELKEADASKPVAQLQYWYSKATRAERKAFKKWMIDQE